MQSYENANIISSCWTDLYHIMTDLYLTKYDQLLSNRKQRTKINSELSSWENNLFGVPQRSTSELNDVWSLLATQMATLTFLWVAI